MARQPPAASDPQEWLRRARGNLARARKIGPGFILEDLCYDAQQAAEKAIKAVFVQRNEVFPYAHDLTQLLTLLQTNGLKIPKYAWAADKLTRFAIETRYPSRNTVVPVTRREHRGAVRIAEAIVRWATRLCT